MLRSRFGVVEQKKTEVEEQKVVKKEEEKKEAKKEEAKKEEAKAFEQGMSISSFVKKEFVDDLTSLGFSKTVAEKSLYLTGCKSVDAAVEWIEKHQQEPDFEEEIRIVGYTKISI